MDLVNFESILSVGETITVEFKSCQKGAHDDLYETISSFSNRFGGDIFLGVENNNTVTGVPHNAVASVIKNIVKMIANPEVMSPTLYLDPRSFIYEGKDVIHIHVPVSSEVHSYKKVIYDRVDDADIKTTATSAIASMYIRKQKIFTEQRVFPHIKDEDLRFDLFPRIKQMAINRVSNHPWANLSDKEIIQSAGLIGTDAETGKTGYNLAAVLLLGKDATIKCVCPTYRTDAILRKINTDRYDDRLIVETNLIESYDLLMGFAEKHLWDKFYLEDNISISLRGKISREMLVNTLMHREFISTYFAKFVIERDKMFVENANRASHTGELTPEKFEPNSKNPIIAAFFRNIGYADELGSGVRNLFRYARRYSGKDPQLIEGDIFKIIVPLDDNYSFDAESGKSGNDSENVTTNVTINVTIKLTVAEKRILELLTDNAELTTTELAEIIGKDLRTIQRGINKLRDNGLIARDGSKKAGTWVVKTDN
ncbi:MAG: putative DNA binding domain-containing protein [Firmicutes bacterium]|nr:putative DNA binding domain-containing protein [Bacillota bacterium]